ncbi:uncharacterized protein LOC117319330 [Pecten maximus]|uniref:uncharacterized protein LOC117319330 n=1 Tax=Pecten maximus TaxID=6579 RepID=UPI001458795A|nr:uncharacterized protein LOC117319330 [Pecten maximus]
MSKFETKKDREVTKQQRIVGEFDLVGEISKTMDALPVQKPKNKKLLVNNPTTTASQIQNGGHDAVRTQPACGIANTTKLPQQPETTANDSSNPLLNFASAITTSLSTMLENQKQMNQESRQFMSELVASNHVEYNSRDMFMRKKGLSDPKVNRVSSTLARESHEQDMECEEVDICQQIDNLLESDNGDQSHDQETTQACVDEDSDDMLAELCEEYACNDTTGPDVDPKLATLLTNVLSQNVTEEKIKPLMEKYNRPGNVELLQCTKVNPEIWGKIRTTTRSRDIKLQRSQQRLVKGLVPLVQVVETLIKSKTEKKQLDVQSLVKQLFDSFHMISSGTQEINPRRRELIKPDLNGQYGQLCVQQTAPSVSLFGDDLAKTIKDISETNRLSYKLLSKRPSHVRYTSGYGPKNGYGRGGYHGPPKYQQHAYGGYQSYRPYNKGGYQGQNPRGRGRGQQNRKPRQ